MKLALAKCLRFANATSFWGALVAFGALLPLLAISNLTRPRKPGDERIDEIKQRMAGRRD